MLFYIISLAQGNIIKRMASISLHIFYHLLFSSCIKVVLMGSGLKWVKVNIPQYKYPGEKALLHCDYDLGNDTLYAVKWYKEHEEFYRYVPRAYPHANSYRVEGVTVDISRSDNKTVVLNPVTWKTSGYFRCEVSAEAPSFSSAQAEARMDVVSLAEDNPNITGVQDQYQIGDEIILNCTSGKSRPASTLHWYINEQQVVSPDSLIDYPSIIHENNLESSVLGLRFMLNSRHFQGGSMKIKCVASLPASLWRSDRESVVHSLPVKDLKEALLLVTNWTNRACSNTYLLLLVVFFIST